LEGDKAMKLFKKKKIYKVEFRDEWNDYGCVIVNATDMARAWKVAQRQFSKGSTYRPMICIAITEIEEV
jgi:hypothetical protein